MQAHIIKRLTLIKGGIELGDSALIRGQLPALIAEQHDALSPIVKSLTLGAYHEALGLIETLIARHQGVITWIDPAIAALKLELQTLEEQLVTLADRKVEMVTLLAEFNTQYQLKLGDIIQGILRLRRDIAAVHAQAALAAEAAAQAQLAAKQSELARLQAELTATCGALCDRAGIAAAQTLLAQLDQLYVELAAHHIELDAATADSRYQEYAEATQDNDDFAEEFAETTAKAATGLSAEDKKRLKTLFRQAAKRCHPDVVSAEYLAEATALMSELNVANEQQDLATVERIAQQLASGQGFAQASVVLHDQTALQQQVATLRAQLAALNDEVEALAADPDYVMLVAVTDWDSYFAELASELQAQHADLAQHYAQLIEEN